jgi:hypothetical protein
VHRQFRLAPQRVRFVNDLAATCHGPANRLRQGFRLRWGYGGQDGGQEAGHYDSADLKVGTTDMPARKLTFSESMSRLLSGSR